jgi:hypothetical protein
MTKHVAKRLETSRLSQTVRHGPRRRTRQKASPRSPFRRVQIASAIAETRPALVQRRATARESFGVAVVKIPLECIETMLGYLRGAIADPGC